METKIVKIDPENIDEEAVAQAGRIIRNGGLVAFPTETVYGLGGDALNPEASKKIYAAKGRPSDNPLIVHIADMTHLAPIVQEVPEKAKLLAEKWWPGPLTMIFRKTDRVPYETSGGLDTVAVRMPNHPVALALIRQSGGYIAAPSANTSGRPSPTLARHVAEDLNGRIEMILDGGEVRIGLESTIVDFTEEVPVILRPGYINEKMLSDLLGEVRMDPGIQSENEHIRPKAPGMRYRHYAPKAELTIVEGKKEDVVRTISRMAALAEAQKKKAGIIAASETAALYTAADVREIGSRAEDKEIARNLYAVLRDFDEDGVDVIYSESFETPRMGQAIMNRLLKAAGHRVIIATDTTQEGIMGKVTIMDHPLIQHKIGIIRRKETGTKLFREMVSEIAMLECFEATRDLKLRDIPIETPMGKTTAKMLAGKKLAVIPILRAGLGMVPGMQTLIPSAKVGHIGLYRDPKTLAPVEYYCKLPPDIEERDVFVVDPMLATGGSASAAITMLKQHGCRNIRFLCIIGAPVGLKKLQEEHPDVDIYIGALDEKLNDTGYIVPGLGDAGDRIFGTK